MDVFPSRNWSRHLREAEAEAQFAKALRNAQREEAEALREHSITTTYREKEPDHDHRHLPARRD